jgi:hypothetical protein
MLEAAIKERLDVAGGRRAVRRAKTLARVLVLLAGCLLLTACPPDGGDLVPLASGDGASVATTSFEGDTLVVTREGVTLRARGRWSVADAATSVILEASNANAEPVTIDFGRGKLYRPDIDGGWPITLLSVARESGAFLPEKRAEIGGGGSATFVLEFKMESRDGRSGVPRDVAGQTARLRLPVEVRPGATTDFLFSFKYSERRWWR